MEAKTKPTTKSDSSHAGGHGMNVLSADAHGEELREVGEEGREKKDWKHELESLLAQLNEMMSRASTKGHDKGAHGSAVSHPLVVAAVITGLITGGSSLLLHIFQDREAHNQRANELYKSKLDFVTVFGDSFPRSLNALYLNQSEMVWLKCFPISYYADAGDDGAIKAYKAAETAGTELPAPTAEALKARESHRASFEESARSRLAEKKPTAMCAQALALFGREEGGDIQTLLKTVRAIQDIADDPAPPAKWSRHQYKELDHRLSSLHNDANELFAKMLETMGTQLSGSEAGK